MKFGMEHEENTSHMDGLKAIVREQARKTLVAQGEENPSEERIQQIVDDVFKDLLKDNPAV